VYLGVHALRHRNHLGAALSAMPILDTADDGSWFVMPLAEGNLDEL
jgi:hypothetical protein